MFILNLIFKRKEHCAVAGCRRSIFTFEEVPYYVEAACASISAIPQRRNIADGCPPREMHCERGSKQHFT